jgi:hypothetical protein
VSTDLGAVGVCNNVWVTSHKPDPLAPRPSLDFSKGVRGKHFKRMREGTNIVLIAPDLLDTFPDSEAVNDALRSLKKTPLALLRKRKTASATR